MLLNGVATGALDSGKLEGIEIQAYAVEMATPLALVWFSE